MKGHGFSRANKANQMRGLSCLREDPLVPRFSASGPTARVITAQAKARAQARAPAWVANIGSELGLKARPIESWQSLEAAELVLTQPLPPLPTPHPRKSPKSPLHPSGLRGPYTYDAATAEAPLGSTLDLRRKTAAEISVMISPTGKGSMNVYAMFTNGF